MRYQKGVKTFAISSLVIISILLSILFVYDPLRIFHKPWLYRSYLQPNMREQALGIIKNFDFDSIIIGSSVLENTSSKEASQKLGGTFVNISLAGSSYYERSIVLKYLFARKEIKGIIYSLDSGGLFGTSTEGKGNYATSNWSYLYDDNPFNDIEIYLNNKYAKCLLHSLSKRRCMGRVVDMDRPSAWYKYPVNASKFGGLKHWFNPNDDYRVKSAYQNILNIIEAVENGEVSNAKDSKKKERASIKYLNQNILRFASSHPSTTFYLLLPPYSRLDNALLVQYHKSAYQRWQTSLRYLVAMSHKYKNIKIYGWGSEPFIDDMSNYKDRFHYSHKINSWILDAIASDKGRLTNSNIKQYIDVFTKKSMDFNLSIVGDMIRNYLQ